jgi:hypothetical protein
MEDGTRQDSWKAVMKETKAKKRVVPRDKKSRRMILKRILKKLNLTTGDMDRRMVHKRQGIISSPPERLLAYQTDPAVGSQ